MAAGTLFASSRRGPTGGRGNSSRRPHVRRIVLFGTFLLVAGTYFIALDLDYYSSSLSSTSSLALLTFANNNIEEDANSAATRELTIRGGSSSTSKPPSAQQKLQQQWEGLKPKLLDDSEQQQQQQQHRKTTGSALAIPQKSVGTPQGGGQKPYEMFRDKDRTAKLSAMVNEQLQKTKAREEEGQQQRQQPAQQKKISVVVGTDTRRQKLGDHTTTTERTIVEQEKTTPQRQPKRVEVSNVRVKQSSEAAFSQQRTTVEQENTPQRQPKRVELSNARVKKSSEAAFSQQQQQQQVKQQKIIMPDGFITRDESVAGDPLRDPKWNASAAKPLPFSPKTEYLGVLVDAGRHYFPLPWLYNLMDRLADMKYNLIHFRLTDDQAWNVLLENTPSLAYPSHVDNPDLRVYTVPELRALVAYGKKRGISFMPEINVPGHGGAWAGALNGTAIVNCPQFICENGYGVPIDVNNPAIFPLIETVLREIIDIFEDPPFLHLGGDEVNMAEPCFQEVGQRMPNFQAFEDELRKVINKIGYPDDRIVRWEMSGQVSLQRVGAIEQYWLAIPGERMLKVKGRFMFSTRMYFDTNGQQDASEVYSKAEVALRFPNQHAAPTAIIAATFELSPTFWYDRNVLGRLLSVAMGAAQIHVQEKIPAKDMKRGLNAKYEVYCNILGLGPTICKTEGKPVISTTAYQAKWKRGWNVWKKAICNRLTDTMAARAFKSSQRTNTRTHHRLATPHPSAKTRTMALDYFAENFATESVVEDEDRAVLADGLLPDAWASLGRHNKDKVPELAGVIFDLTRAKPKVADLMVILEEFVAKLGLNTVQLRLAGNAGWTFDNPIKQVTDRSFSYTQKDLQDMDTKATQLGLQVIPEISVSSDANGYYSTGLMAKCASRFCEHGIPFDISQSIVPVSVFSQVNTLQKCFPSSRFLHLGSDERQDSLSCFEEASTRNAGSASISLADFDVYEKRLSKMLQLGDDVKMEHILRWENVEHKRYAQRTGNITHYRAGTDIREVRTRDGPFFMTVDLLQKDADGSVVAAWDIYQHARSLVDIKPMGIMADIGAVEFEGWEDWEIPQRVLVFSMAVSELPILEDESSFTSMYTQICQATLAIEPCTPPTAIAREKFPKETVPIDEVMSAQCRDATMVEEIHVMKQGTPYFNETGKKLLLEQPSKAIWALS